jgi:membrane fusion protein, multidrug efflux system
MPAHTAFTFCASCLRGLTLRCVFGYGVFCFIWVYAPSLQAQTGGQPVIVQTHIVQESRKTHSITVLGTVQAEESVTIRPEVAGRITAFPFDEGQRVRAGQPLVLLDERIEKAELAQALAQSELALSAHRRTQALFERGFVSDLALEEARARLTVARAQVELAQARVARRTLRAPFDGYVGLRLLSPGEYVKEGTDLIRIDALDRLQLLLHIPERYVGLVAVGQALHLQSDVFPEERFQAHVRHIAPTLESATRSLAVKARLENPKERLRPGLFVRLSLILEDDLPALWIPEEAMVSNAAGLHVFQIKNDKAHLVRLETGLRQEGEMAVLGGLAPGDEIVLAGHHKLRDGQAIVRRTKPETIDRDE